MPGSRGGIEAGKAYVTGYLDDSALVRGLKGLRSKFASAARTLGTFAIGAVSGAIAASGGIFAPIAKAAEAQQLEAAFTTLLGGADKAKAALADIRKFAAETPFQFPELADATRKLLAFGVAQEDLIPTMRAIGDVSAGIGAPIGEIAEIYGKAKVQGRLFMEDINQLTGRGIPVIQELAAQFGVAESEVRKLVETGQVNFGHLQVAFQSLTGEGGKFFNLMETQSQTAAGRFSTLQDRWNEFVLSMGNVLLPAVENILTTINQLGDFFAATTKRMGIDWGGFIGNLAAGFAQWDSWISSAQASAFDFAAWLDEWRLGGRVETEIGKGLRDRAATARQEAQKFADEAAQIVLDASKPAEAPDKPVLANNIPEAANNVALVNRMQDVANQVGQAVERSFTSAGTFSGRAASFIDVSNDRMLQVAERQVDILEDIRDNTEEEGIAFE